MEQNIYQVIEEQHVDEILQDHSQQITVIMFSSKGCSPCKEIKPKFIAVSKQQSDCMFLYIDISNFKNTAHKYTKDVTYTPHFSYYFGGKEIIKFSGAHEQALNEIILSLKEKINIKRQESMQKELEIAKQKHEEIIKSDIEINQPAENIIAKKIEILNKLRALTQQGAKLSKAYNLESDYEELLLEYELQTNPHANQNQEQLTDQQIELLKKQEYAKKIQDLNRVNQMMQMNQFYKLQQLKQLHKFKEQQEKKENDDTKEK